MWKNFIGKNLFSGADPIAFSLAEERHYQFLNNILSNNRRQNNCALRRAPPHLPPKPLPPAERKGLWREHCGAFLVDLDDELKRLIHLTNSSCLTFSCGLSSLKNLMAIESFCNSSSPKIRAKVAPLLSAFLNWFYQSFCFFKCFCLANRFFHFGIYFQSFFNCFSFFSIFSILFLK